jgi:hypothetical protein
MYLCVAQPAWGAVAYSEPRGRAAMLCAAWRAL